MMPLNTARRDHALNEIARRHGKPVTQYDICKLHVMVDVFHVLEYGKPAFGGAIEAWDYGPVVPHTFRSARRWAIALAFAVSATQSKHNFPFHVAGTNEAGNVFQFVPSPTYSVNREDFSPSLERAMERASNLVLGELSDFGKSQKYFHGEIPSAIGHAWKVARASGAMQLNWFDVLDGAQHVEGRDVELARAHAELWV